MKSRREVVSGSVVLSLLLLTAPALADESAPSSEFTYTDDWAVVSAPPPPGPYRSVNIDPRVPGGDAIPPLSILPVDAVKTSTVDDIPVEALENPPAAGIPATLPSQDSPASTLDTQQSAQPVISGHTERVAPSPPGYYSAPPAGYSGYRNQPAYGYYGAPVYRQGEQQVPPPPAYDAMMRNQRPYGHPAGTGAP